MTADQYATAGPRVRQSRAARPTVGLRRLAACRLPRSECSIRLPKAAVKNEGGQALARDDTARAGVVGGGRKGMRNLVVLRNRVWYPRS